MGFAELPDEPDAPRVHQVRDRPDDLRLTRSGIGERGDEVEKRDPSSLCRMAVALFDGQYGCVHGFYTPRFRKVFRLTYPNSPCGSATLGKTYDSVTPRRAGSTPHTLKRP